LYILINLINQIKTVNMKKLKFLFYALSAGAFVAFTGCQQSGESADYENDDADVAVEAVASVSAEMEEPEEKSQDDIPSPRKQATGEAGGATITVDYGSPGVKGRKIWGGLEAYGKVWRAGANKTTSIEISSDVTIGGTALAAGKYAIKIIPNEDEDWVVIFNTNWDVWGTSYNKASDVARVSVKPDWADEVEERLTYSIEDSSLNFAWDKARISLAIE